MTLQEGTRLPAVVTPVPRRLRLPRDRILIGSFVILAFLLRLPNLGRAYWIDEGISVGIASHPVRQIPGLLRLDGSPPLFYVILHFWIKAFGTSEVATHFLPMTVSLIMVPLAYWAGTDLFDRRVGLAAAALFATNPFLSWYSTETRMYPMVVALTLAGVTFASRATRDRRLRDAIAAVACFAGLLYTHDWGLYATAVTAGVLLVLALRQGDRRLALWVAGGLGAVVVLWLPWVPSFVDQAQNTAAPWAVRPNLGYLVADPTTALGGTLGIVIAPLLAFGAWFTRGRRPPEYAYLAGTLAGIGVLTGLAGFLGSQVEPSWTVRYLAVIVAPILLGGAGAMGTSRRGQAIVAGACVLLAGWSIVGTLLPNPNARYAKSNVAAIAEAVAPQLVPGDVVVVTQTEQLAVLAHYLPAGLRYVTPTGPVSDPYVVDWRNIVSRLHDASPCAAVAPAIDDLPIGAHVLEVDPVRKLGAKGSAWSSAVSEQVRAVDLLLGTDPSLDAIGSYTQATSPRPYSPIVGELFRKTAGVSPCT
jgi:hypothetical protein